jgi:hypothetical protein
MYYFIYVIRLSLISTFLVTNVTFGNSVANSDIRSINTRHSTGPYCIKINSISKRAYYFAIRVFNHLPSSLKILSNELKQFRPASKEFLLTNSFCSLELCFNWN